MKFTTERLQLRQIESADWQLYLKLSTDKRVIEKLAYAIGGNLFDDHIYTLNVATKKHMA